MGTERNDSAWRGTEQQAQRRELLNALREAVDGLSACLNRLDNLIDRVSELADDSVPEPERPRTQIHHGGGASALHSVDRSGRHERREASIADRRLAATEDRRGSDAGDRRQGGSGSGERRGALNELLAGEETGAAGHRERSPRRHNGARRIGTAELMAVSEMVHLGYSRDEISDRLRARWGDEASAILREALD